jgi:hypothetical protein
VKPAACNDADVTVTESRPSTGLARSRATIAAATCCRGMVVCREASRLDRRGSDGSGASARRGQVSRPGSKPMTELDEIRLAWPLAGACAILEETTTHPTVCSRSSPTCDTSALRRPTWALSRGADPELKRVAA